MRVAVSELLNYSRHTFRKQAYQRGDLNYGDVVFSDSKGVHIYSDLQLSLSLSAADSLGNAAKFLQILQAYAGAADAVASTLETRVLEVQGTRLHLFRSLENPTQQEIRRTVLVARAFYHLATNRIREIAGDVDFNIRMAADWGRAVLLLSGGSDESESIVSLGMAANRPAKHLSRQVNKNGVPARHLALNKNAIFDPSGAPSWELVDLEYEGVSKSASADELVAFSAANSAYVGLSKGWADLANRDFAPNPQNPVYTPIVRHGFMFRADLDGFSKRVQLAMNGNEGDVVSLVQEFSSIMQYPAEFKNQLPKGVSVLQFPWAGDCANMLLECDDYNLERTYLPNLAGEKWHEQGRTSSTKAGTRNWSQLIRDTKWLVAIAGGDNDGADHGSILTGNIVVDSRTFHVGAGWGWQRSLDAEQSEGTSPEETVIQVEDYRGLDDEYRAPYREHKENPTLFKVASYEALRRAATKRQEALKVSKPVFHIATGLAVPAPRPYVRF